MMLPVEKWELEGKKLAPQETTLHTDLMGGPYYPNCKAVATKCQAVTPRVAYAEVFTPGDLTFSQEV